MSARAERYKKALQEALKDTARLDWLTEGGHYIAHSRDGDCCWVMFNDEESEDTGYVRKQPNNFSNPRDAIDFAMMKEK